MLSNYGDYGVASVYTGGGLAEIQIRGPIGAIDSVHVAANWGGRCWRGRLIANDQHIAKWVIDARAETEVELREQCHELVEKMMESPVGISRIQAFMAAEEHDPSALVRGNPGDTPLVVPTSSVNSANRQKV
jgi:hypothetical protein